MQSLCSFRLDVIQFKVARFQSPCRLPLRWGGRFESIELGAQKPTEQQLPELGRRPYEQLQDPVHPRGLQVQCVALPSEWSDTPFDGWMSNTVTTSIGITIRIADKLHSIPRYLYEEPTQYQFFSNSRQSGTPFHARTLTLRNNCNYFTPPCKTKYAGLFQYVRKIFKWPVQDSTLIYHKIYNGFSLHRLLEYFSHPTVPMPRHLPLES